MYPYTLESIQGIRKRTDLKIPLFGRGDVS